MTGVYTRPMTQADIARVSEIENACFMSPWPIDAFERELERGGLCVYIVAEARGVITGYAGARFMLEEAHVTSVAVDKEYRRRGTGEALMRALISAAKDAGCLFMELETRAGNTAAQALYHKLGFIRVGLKKGYYDDTGEDAIIMALFPLQGAG